MIEVNLEEDDKEQLEKMIKIEHLHSALKQCKNGKNPGEDRLTYEFWKWAHKMTIESDKEKDDSIAIMQLMKEYLEDIETNGPIDESFAKGLLFPIYKKGDEEDIANYRPIMLLNTDYKLYTRTIAHKLTRACQKVIHEDQAGFMPGRSIYDHTRCINIIEEACETKEINRYIIALDQEKAYDKIDQSYLWKALRAFGMPGSLATRIRKIYKSATTQVVINGQKGEIFIVGRGTRQGDPMSCILYNLAIEPLAIALRKSTLQGIKLSNSPNKKLLTMYADDTALTISEQDDIRIAKETIGLFCTASTARFNDSKEEVMPVGTPVFKRNFIETRTMICRYRVPDHVKIITPENPTRMLGAWHGNKGIAKDQWRRIIDKQQDIIDLWAQSRPTFRARVLLLKSLIQSRALYLAMVNGMPKNIETEMTKQMADFFWLGRKPQVTWEQLCQPIERGGVNAPSVKARNKAIDIMWLQRCFKDIKPKWAEIANHLINKHSIKKEREAVTAWLQQRADIVVAKLPKIVQRIIRIAKQTNLGISPALPSDALRLSMPALFHIAANQNMYRDINCLVQKHEIQSIRSLQVFTERAVKGIEKDKDSKG
jgi:hypothetical protein